MPALIDAAHAQLTALLPELRRSLENAENEAECRFQVVDRLLTEVLGWNRTDLKLEHVAASGRLDYLLSVSGRPHAVVEAKSLDTLWFTRSHEGGRAYRLSGPVFSHAPAAGAIEQAANYTKASHVSLSVVTNGSDWIVFRGNRTDGIDYREGAGFLFRGLDDINLHFLAFFDLLHKSSVERLRYIDALAEEERSAIPPRFGKALVPANKVERVPNSSRSREVEAICARFFREITNASDPEMLERCFIETDESRQADARLERITRHLTTQIDQLGAASNALIDKIEDVLEARHSETGVIVGVKGGGKSTFLSRFFSTVLPPETRDRCVVHRIDLASAPSDASQIHNWLNTALLTEVDARQRDLGAESADHLQGVFFSEYQRWSRQAHRVLYETDKPQFKIKFEEHIERLRHEQPHEYIAAFLGDLSRNRRLLPIVVLDNVDHHPVPLQEVVFQFAVSFSRHPKVAVLLALLPVTVRTLWQLSKERAFESYFALRFYLPPPPPMQVMRKRLSYIRDKVEEAKRSTHSGEYAISASVKVSFADLEHFVVAIQESVLDNSVAERAIAQLSNGDVRRALELTQRVVASPYVRTGDLLKSYVTGEPLVVPSTDIMNALVCGDLKAYRSEDNPFVSNVFQIVSRRVISPLLVGRLLLHLEAFRSRAEASNLLQEGDVPIGDVTGFFLGMGYRQSDIAACVDSMLERGIVESHDPTQLKWEDAEHLAITDSGRLHLTWMLSNLDYVARMAEATDVYSEADHAKMLSAFAQLPRSDTALTVSTFIQYCVRIDEQACLCPPTAEYAAQRELASDVLRNWS